MVSWLGGVTGLADRHHLVRPDRSGPRDTGELEAQVRGSRHAWDIRLISADALVKLTQLKENTEGTETGRKIRSLLTPMEYTRLDQMIDVNVHYCEGR